jgi:hypothetical protein
MEFASLIPLLLKRCVLPVACIGLASISSFAQQPVFFEVDSTPYDNQMTRVYPILASGGSHSSGPVSLKIVNQSMINLHAIRYRYSKQWKTPDEVQFLRTADCKGKAIALYDEMVAEGAENVRLIIGQYRAGDSLTHAWVEWDTENGSYVLDPTFNWLAVKAERQNSRKYIPFYGYQGEHKYQTAHAPFVAPTANVVAGYSKQFSLPVRVGSTFAQPGPFGDGAGQSFSATTEFATLRAQPLQSDAQPAFALEGLRRGEHSWYKAQCVSPNVEGARYPKALAVRPNAAQRVSPDVEGVRYPKALAVRSTAEYVIRVQPRSAASGL